MQFRRDGGRRGKRAPTEINITPLIDIVFQLLIFFMITSTFADNALETPGINVELAKSSSAKMSAASSKNVVITITKEGRFIYLGKAVSADDLTHKLTATFTDNPNQPVIIQADSKTNHGTVIQVMDTVRTIGFPSLVVATQAP